MTERAEDKLIMEDKVGRYFRGASKSRSFASMDRFVQFTAIAIIAASKTEYLSAARYIPAYYEPWVNLARRLGYDELASALEVILSPSVRRPELPMVCWWYQESLKEGAGLFHKRIRAWFDRDVTPLIEAERQLALRPAAFDILGPRSSRTLSPKSAYHRDSTVIMAARGVFKRLSSAQGQMDHRTFTKIHDQVLGKLGGLRLEPHVYYSDPTEIFYHLARATATARANVEMLPSASLNHSWSARSLGPAVMGGLAFGADQWDVYASAVFATVGRNEFLRRFGSNLDVQSPKLLGTSGPFSTTSFRPASVGRARTLA
jgi:hypothetical protein